MNSETYKEDDGNLYKDGIENYGIKLGEEEPNWVRKFEIKPYEDYALDVYGGIKYLLFDWQYNVEATRKTKFIRNIKQVVNMQGVEDSSNILIDFNPQKSFLHIHKILIYRKEKLIIDKLLVSDMQVLRREHEAEYSIISGSATLSVILPDIKIDDIIELSYSVVNVNLLDVKFFNEFMRLEYSVPIHQLYFAVITDNNVKFHYKFLNKKDELQKSEYLDKKIYSLSLRDIPAKKVEKYIPYWYSPFLTLQIGVEKSWNDIAVQISDFYSPVAAEEKIIIDLIADLKKDNLSDEEIIVRSLKFIFENIRYTANYKVTDYIKPTDPNITVKRLYGDCKDLTFLLHTILNYFEIESYPVLVNTNYGKNLNGFLPAMNVFNHVILLVKLNEEQYFIDATFRQEIDSLKNLCLPEYSYGLVCNNSSVELSEIKNTFSCSNQVSVLDEYEVLSWEDNKFTLKTKMVLEGMPALRLIHYVKNKSKQNLLDLFHDFYNKFVIIEELISHVVDLSEVGKNKISLSTKYKISMRAIAKKQGEYLCEIIPADLLEYFVCDLPEKVDEDFYYGSLVEVDYKIFFIDEKIKFRGKKETIVSDDAFFMSKIGEQGKDKIVFSYQFNKLKQVIFCERYESFCSNYLKAKALLQIVIRKPEKININVARMFFMIFVLANVIYHFMLKDRESYALPTTVPHANQSRHVSNRQLKNDLSNGGGDQNVNALVNRPLTIDFNNFTHQ